MIIRLILANQHNRIINATIIGVRLKIHRNDSLDKDPIIVIEHNKLSSMLIAINSAI